MMEEKLVALLDLDQIGVVTDHASIALLTIQLVYIFLI